MHHLRGIRSAEAKHYDHILTFQHVVPRVGGIRSAEAKHYDCCGDIVGPYHNIRGIRSAEAKHYDLSLMERQSKFIRRWNPIG